MHFLPYLLHYALARFIYTGLGPYAIVVVLLAAIFVVVSWKKRWR